MVTISRVFKTSLATLSLVSGILIGTGTASAIEFSDVRGDLYEDEIREAAQLNLISGFPDGTFRPDFPITREQIVAINLSFLNNLTRGGFPVRSGGSGSTFYDVEYDRWSYNLIETAHGIGLVTGYPDGSFRPDRRISRAELMTILYNASAIASETAYGVNVFSRLPDVEHPFADVDSHWAYRGISTMYGLCGAASALEETGARFAPDRAATRAYAAAATVRALNCLQNMFGGR